MRGHPLLRGRIPVPAAVLIAAACTFDEGGLAGGTLAPPPVPDASPPPPDMGRTTPDMPPACDPATDPCCERREGERFCREGRPATCRGGDPGVHRDCPQGSACREEAAAAFCGAPADCVACGSGSGSGCGAGQVCNVFAGPTGQQYCCVPPLGAGGLGDPCARAADCDTGVCVEGTCFHACIGRPSACDEAGAECRIRRVIVDGSPRDLQTCVP